MKEIINIKGYWDDSFEFDFNEQNMWEGKFIKDEDGWIEGIVVDPYSTYTEPHLIFGVYLPSKCIEILKLTSTDISDAFKFHGDINKHSYSGEFTIIDESGESLCGVCKISTQNLIASQDEMDLEIQKLQDSIDSWKQGMDETNRMFYDNAIAIREQMIEIIGMKFENSYRSLSQTEDIEDAIPVEFTISDEVQNFINTIPPMTSEEIQAFINDGKKKGKRRRKNPDGLPF